MGERVRGEGERFNPGPPSEPRPAASIVLLRRGGKHKQRALQVLMLQRTEEARFMPGLWVFPGGSVDPDDGEGETGHRVCAARELREEAAIELPADAELVPFCRWITPEFVSTRFDARFYLALAPAHTPPRPDGVEMTAAAWYTPAEALTANDAGELQMAFPTRHQLEMLRPFASSDEVLSAHRERQVEPILPKLIGEGDDRRLVLPGDAGYPA